MALYKLINTYIYTHCYLPPSASLSLEPPLRPPAFTRLVSPQAVPGCQRLPLVVSSSAPSSSRPCVSSPPTPVTSSPSSPSPPLSSRSTHSRRWSSRTSSTGQWSTARRCTHISMCVLLAAWKYPYKNTIQIPLNGTRGYYGQGYLNGI